MIDSWDLLVIERSAIACLKWSYTNQLINADIVCFRQTSDDNTVHPWNVLDVAIQRMIEH